MSTNLKPDKNNLQFLLSISDQTLQKLAIKTQSEKHWNDYLINLIEKYDSDELDLTEYYNYLHKTDFLSVEKGIISPKSTESSNDKKSKFINQKRKSEVVSDFDSSEQKNVVPFKNYNRLEEFLHSNKILSVNKVLSKSRHIQYFVDVDTTK